MTLPVALPEGVRAARQRARPEICWTNSLKSSITSSTQSLIRRASCAWCPETTCSTGSTLCFRVDHNQHTRGQVHFSNEMTQMRRNFHWCEEIHWYCGSSVKEGFFPHCFASTEVACESSLFRRVRRAKLLKPLSTATLIRPRLCVCVLPYTNVDLRCWPCLYLFYGFIFVDFSASGSVSLSLLSCDCVYIALFVTVMYTQSVCVQMCQCVCRGHIPCLRPQLSCSLMRW